jgi:hypothetical protein
MFEDLYKTEGPEAPLDATEAPSIPNPSAYLKDYLLRKMDEKQNTADLEAAQQQYRQASGMTDIAEAGTRALQAAVGGTPNADFGSSRERDKQILQDYLTKKAQEKQLEREKLDSAKLLADMEEKEKAAALKASSPKKPAFKSEEILPNPSGKGLIKKITLRDETGNPISSYTESASQEEYKRQQDEQDAAFKKESLRLGWGNLNQRGYIQGTKEQTKISDALLKYDLPGMEKSISTIEGLSKVGGNGETEIPGFATDYSGQLGIKMRSMAGKLSPEETKARATFQYLANEELKSNSGAAVTNGEYRRFLESIQAGSLVGFTPLQVTNYLNMLKGQIEEKKNVIRNMAPDTFDRQYGKAKPTTQPDLTNVNEAINKTSPPSTEKRVNVIKDGKRFSIPERQLKQALSEGYEQTK